ncbi:MAG TPA: glycosyltransferase [Phycisphaerales bacterium]|nr:glycosyltransferase [Phycisphaerales bacterium]
MTDHAPRQSDPPDKTGPTVRGVVPVWNRPGDLIALLGDLAATKAQTADLALLIVDNGSDNSIQTQSAIAQAAAKVPFPVEFLRLPTNTGGSGGFNAGIRASLADHDPDFIWLVDSDVRLEPDTFEKMVGAIVRDKGIVGVGPEIADPATGELFETGGRIDRASGRLVAAMPNDDGGPIDYIAACCALVRADAVRRVGLLPDTFIHSDDVLWCLRLAKATSGRFEIATGARCRHPRFDRFKTWARYYEARNWVGVAAEARVGMLGRFRRAFREVALALEQSMIGCDDLAELHLRGLHDALAGQLVGKASPDRTRHSRIWPWHALDPAIRAIVPSAPSSAAAIAEIHTDAPVPRDRRPALGKLLRELGLETRRREAMPSRSFKQMVRGFVRLLVTSSNAIAVVNAKAPPHAWAAARVLLIVSPQGFRIHRVRPVDRLASLFNTAARSVRPLVGLTWSLPEPPPSEPIASTRPGERPSLSIIILTRNRIDQLLHTLAMLEQDEVGAQSEIIVVDNASTDGTPTRVRREFERVKVIPTGANLGVEGFNRGVEASTGDAVLILDDDAWPNPGALAGALDLLAERPDVAGIMLHRQHPRTNEHEWPFERIASRLPRWPDMGSGNIIRRSAWDAVGGYESGYFLYRNDTDLALKLLGAGYEVMFTPDLHVWHDSPISKTKTAPWLFRSTRNWVWLCKRHGRRGSGLLAILLGWLWAHKLAGFSPVKHWAALRGALAGLFTRAPKLESSTKPDGKALARLIRLKMGLRGGR